MHEQAAGFALDALDDDESTEFEQHLFACPACEDALEPLRLAAAAMAFAGELPSPRPELRVRVLHVGAAVIPLHRRFRGQLISAGAVAAACLVLVAVLQPWHDGGVVGMKRFSATGSGHATLLVGPIREAVLVVHGLPHAPGGKAYEAWVVTRGHASPAGLLHGSLVALTRPVPPGASVALSLEPTGGSPQPTGPLVLRTETT